MRGFEESCPDWIECGSASKENGILRNKTAPVFYNML